jgi:hypothetical protein
MLLTNIRTPARIKCGILKRREILKDLLATPGADEVKPGRISVVTGTTFRIIVFDFQQNYDAGMDDMRDYYSAVAGN